MAKAKKGKADGKKAHKNAKHHASPIEKHSPVEKKVEIPPEPEVKKYDPCRFSAECCSEELGCRPNSYPGILECPEPMAIVGSESGTYESICKLLMGGFRCANRILMMTPWGNYVLFRVKGQIRTVFFLYDGCTCNVNRFRYYDLNIGTAGLLFFKSTHEILHYIMHSKLRKQHYNSMQKNVIDEICREYSTEFCSKKLKQSC